MRENFVTSRTKAFKVAPTLSSSVGIEREIKKLHFPNLALSDFNYLFQSGISSLLSLPDR